MIVINWKKGELELKGNIDNLLMEYSILTSSLYELIKQSGISDNGAKKVLTEQMDVGISMGEDKKDYITDEKYMEGARDEI